MRPANHRRHARLDQLGEPRRVVAQRLDGDAHDILVRRAGDREGMAVPAVLRLQVDERELARQEVNGSAQRAQHNLGQPLRNRAHLGHLVVVQREEEAREHLAVDVEGDADRADHHVAPAQHRLGPPRRSVQHAVQEAGRDEEARRAVQQAPALVAAEDAAHLAHAREILRLADQHAQWPRHHRLPAWQDRPDHQRQQADHADRAERPTDPALVLADALLPVRGEDVRGEQHEPEDGDAPVPDRGAVDAVEPLLDPGQRADQDQRDRQQQHRLRAEELPDVAAGVGARRLQQRPEHAERHNEHADRDGAGLAGDEADAVHLHEASLQRGEPVDRPCAATGRSVQSGRRESNPRDQLGRLELYH